MASTARRSLIFKLFLPNLCLSLAAAGMQLYLLQRGQNAELMRHMAPQATLIADGLRYEMETHGGMNELGRLINAQAERDNLVLAVYVAEEAEPRVVFSSSSEWDGIPLYKLTPTRLRKHIFTAFSKKDTQQALHPDASRYYYSQPVEFLIPGQKRPQRGALAIVLDTTDMQTLQHADFMRQAMISGSCALGLPFLFTLIVYGLCCAPLHRIIEVVEDRVSGNNFATIEAPPRGELGYLAHALNVLFEKQKKAEQGIRYSSDLVQTVIDNVPGIIFWKDRNLTYLGCNQAFSGVADDNNIDHVIGRKNADLKLAPELAELYARHDEAVMKSNAAIVQEEFLLTSGGEARWIEMHKIPLRDDRKRVMGVLGLCFDITQRKHVEKELEQTSKHNRLLFEMATRIRVGGNTKLHVALRKICSTVVTSLDIDRASIWRFSDDRREIHLQSIEGKAAGDIRPNTHYRTDTAGAYYETLSSGRPIIAHNSHTDPLAGVFLGSRLAKYDNHAMMEIPIVVAGSVWGTLCLEAFRHYAWNQQEEQFVRSLADIIAMMIVNEQYLEISNRTRDQKDFLELILEAASEGVWDWRVKEDMVTFSSRWKSMLGYEDHEIQDSTEAFYALVHPEDRERVQRAIAEYLARREGVYEIAFRMRTRQGAYRWILSRGKSSFDNNGNALRFVGTHTDITYLKNAEEELSRQKYMLDKIIEHLPVGMFAKDVRDTFRYKIWNRQMERIFDRQRAAIVGLNDHDLFEKKEADYRLFTDKQLLEIDVPVEIYEEIQSEWGRTVSVNIKKFALFDQNHEPELIIGIVDDITDLMDAQRELEEHRHHLESLVEEQTHDLILAKEEAEKANQAKSDFLANMSHELRTPMHAIISYSQLGLDKTGTAEMEKILKYFSNINKSGRRLLHLLNDLLDLSKMEAGQMEYHFAKHDMTLTLANLKEELRSLLEQKSLKLSVKNQARVATAWYDENRIVQVLMNLVSNAIKFSEEHKTIHIVLEDELLNVPNGALDALSISVVDEGVGIPEPELKEIFDKFSQSSRTKTGAGGTGLGLAISREIVAAHHGLLWAENNPAGGAKFTLVIPKKESTIG